jgi:O-succinylbenzoic acid--CoA ligase
MVPLQAQNAIADPATNKFFASIRNIIIGGASVSPKLEQQLSAYSNNIYATFAMTETLSHIALRKLTGEGKKDLYTLMHGVKISEDERGCLVIDAPHLSDERIVTNDIIIKTDEKHFHWLGRYDNVINSGGVKIYPEAVETKLANLFDEKRFFISSVPDETLGQKVVLVIESKSALDKNDLQNKIEKLVDKYEIPKEYYAISEFTETPNGKIQRQETLKLAIK